MDWLALDERGRFRCGLLAADRVAAESLALLVCLDGAADDVEPPPGEAPCARAETLPVGGATANTRLTASRA